MCKAWQEELWQKGGWVLRPGKEGSPDAKQGLGEAEDVQERLPGGLGAPGGISFTGLPNPLSPADHMHFIPFCSFSYENAPLPPNSALTINFPRKKKQVLNLPA